MSENDNVMENEVLEDDGELNEDAVESEECEPEPTISAKDAERKKLEEEIQAFLAKGGEIDRIPANVVSDPPKKPESNYGGQPI